MSTNPLTGQISNHIQRTPNAIFDICNEMTLSERLSLHTALRAITIDAAYVLGMESEIGSIATGKRADFAILDEDPYEVGAEGLKDIPVWGVVFEGKAYPANAE